MSFSLVALFFAIVPPLSRADTSWDSIQNAWRDFKEKREAGKRKKEATQKLPYLDVIGAWHGRYDVIYEKSEPNCPRVIILNVYKNRDIKIYSNYEDDHPELEFTNTHKSFKIGQYEANHPNVFYVIQNKHYVYMNGTETITRRVRKCRKTDRKGRCVPVGTRHDTRRTPRSLKGWVSGPRLKRRLDGSVEIVAKGSRYYEKYNGDQYRFDFPEGPCRYNKSE